MKNIIKYAILILPIFFLAGCIGPDEREMGQIKLIGFPSFIFVTFIFLAFIYFITKNKNISLNKKMGVQLLLLLLFGGIVSLLAIVSVPVDASQYLSPFWFSYVAILILSIPFALCAVSFFVLFLPPKKTFYTPTIVVLVYFIFSILTIIFNSGIFIFLMIVVCFFLIPVSLILIFMARRKYKKIDENKNDKADIIVNYTK